MSEEKGERVKVASVKRLPRRCHTCKFYKDGMCFCPVKDTVALVDEIETPTGVQKIPEEELFDEFGIPRPECMVLIAEPNPTRMEKMLGEFLMSTKFTLAISSCRHWKPKIEGETENG